MIKLEYNIVREDRLGKDDINVHCLDNKNVWEYNSPRQVLQEVFGRHTLVMLSSSFFHICIKKQTYLGTITQHKEV